MSEAFQVAVELNLVDHFSAVIEGFSKHLVETSKHAEELQKKFESIGSSFKTWAAVGASGSGILGMLKASTDEAVRYEQQLNRLKALNLGAGATKNLEDKARAIANSVKGTSETDALALVTQTQAATGNEEQTKMLAPVLAQMRSGIDNYMASHDGGEGKGAEAESQFQALVKVMEARGLTHDMTSEKIDRMADLFTKSFVATGGTVQPSEFLEMMKAGGLGARAMSDDFMLAMGRIMHEKGGANAGAGVMASYQNLATGKMPPEVAETLNKLGLLDKSAIHRGKGGKIESVDAGGLEGSDQLASRPDLFLQEKILPALQKKFGVDTNDQNAVLRQLSSLGGQDGSSDLFAQLYMERDQLKAYIAQSKNAMGYKELQKQGDESVTGQQKELRVQIDKLEGTFGEAALPLLKAALEQAIPLVKELGEWLKEHPKGLRMLVDGLAAVGVGLMVVGPLMQFVNVLKLVSMGATLLATPLSNLAVAMSLREIGGAEGVASVAGNLRSAGGQLKMLGAAAAVFAAYAVGDWVGTKIYENMKPEQRETAGGTIATMLSWMGSKDAQEAIDATMKGNAALSPNEISRLAFERAKRDAATHVAAHAAQATTQAATQAVTKAAAKAGTHATTPPRAASAAADAHADDKHAESKAGKTAAQQKPPSINNYLTVLLDGKEIAARLIPNVSMGTGDFNPSDSKALPGMSNYALHR